MARSGLHCTSPLGQRRQSSFAEDSSSQSAGDSCSWVTDASVSDEEMSIGVGGEAEDAAMSSSSPSNLSGSGGDIGFVGEVRDADVSSPLNLSAYMGGAIRNGIWPGSHNATLISHVVSLHFAGDWSAYLQFAHWADTQLMLYPKVPVHLDSWLSQKSDLVGGVTAPEGDCGLGGLPARPIGIWVVTCVIKHARTL